VIRVQLPSSLFQNNAQALQMAHGDPAHPLLPQRHALEGNGQPSKPSSDSPVCAACTFGNASLSCKLKQSGMFNACIFCACRGKMPKLSEGFPCSPWHARASVHQAWSMCNTFLQDRLLYHRVQSSEPLAIPSSPIV
jgi:hypothetical protein